MAINWGPVASDSRLLEHPLYIKWSNVKISAVAGDPSALKTDLGTALFNNESAEVVAFLSTLIRVGALLG